ncbi:MAG: hypothetical protein JO038_01560, partial [Alphaproteobacteria bacterium]|nr:hypothetical protein [Alphaproteobacteria bacterium]
QVYYYAGLPDGRRVPAVFRTGTAWICAFPLFDIGTEFLVFVPMERRWGGKATMSGFEDMAARLVGGMVRHLCGDGTVPVVKVDDWPLGYANALAVRHDYDRAISDDSLRELLDFHESRGLKCSIGFLSYLAPADQIRLLAARGHEIQIHTWQSDAETFVDDLATLGEIAGGKVAGATIHGNETGFRGDHHYGWFERAGIEYAELFRISYLPAPIYRLSDAGVLRRSSLMGSPNHVSLDTNTTPEEHQLDFIRRHCANLLGLGAAAIAMNHPDINRAALYELLAELGSAATWRTTLRDLVRWARLTKHDSVAQTREDGIALRFPEPLPMDLGVSVAWGGAEPSRHTVPGGSRELFVSRPASATKSPPA